MKITKGYAKGPFGQLHYEEIGGGMPMILLHQMVQSAVQFRPALPVLAQKGVHAVAVDLPGYGMSDTPYHAPSMDEYASIVPAMLEHMGWDKAVICGHHTGAAAACAVAHRHPNIVSKLVVHGVPYYTKEEMAGRASGSHRAKSIVADGSHLQELWEMWYKAGKGEASSDVTQWSVINYFIAGETEWHGHSAVYGHDIWTAVDSIQAPTLLISNTGDMLNPQDRRLSEARPDFEYHEIEGGTFQYVYDDAETWAGIVAEFATRA